MKNFFIDLKRHFLTGISYMIPLVIAGAVIMGIARIGSSFYGVKDIWDASHTQSAHALVRLFHTMDGIGGLALGLMLPFIAGFIAYSIIDKPGIVPGFVAGLLAKDMNTGFLGALVAGVLAGYIVKLILDKIQLPDFASGITAKFLAPVLGTLITCLIMVYIIGVPIATLNKGLEVAATYGADSFYIDWDKHANARTSIILKINSIKEIPVKDKNILNQLLAKGKEATQENAKETAVNDLVSNLTYQLDEAKSDEFVKVYFVEVENTTEYLIKDLGISVNLVNDSGVTVETTYINMDNWKSGSKVRLEFSVYDKEFAKTETTLEYYTAE